MCVVYVCSFFVFVCLFVVLFCFQEIVCECYQGTLVFLSSVYRPVACMHYRGPVFAHVDNCYFNIRRLMTNLENSKLSLQRTRGIATRFQVCMFN